MPNPTRVLLPLLLALLVAGCGARQGPAAEGANVQVNNQSWSDMRIFAEAGGQRARIGTVTGTSTAQLRIPSQMVGLGREISFVADAIAGGQARSFSIFVRPGDRVSITIPPTVR